MSQALRTSAAARPSHPRCRRSVRKFPDARRGCRHRCDSASSGCISAPRWLCARSRPRHAFDLGALHVAAFGRIRPHREVGQFQVGGDEEEAQFVGDLGVARARGGIGVARPRRPAATRRSSAVARMPSSRREAALRIASRSAHNLRCSGDPCSAARPSYQVSNSTDSPRWPGNAVRQISSAVNDRIGAIQRTSASRMRYIALCALRRPWLSAGIVYRRSLVMSRYSAPSSFVQKFCTRCTISGKS